VFDTARWVVAKSDREMKTFVEGHPSNIVLDRDERPVFLSKSAWELDYTKKNNPGVVFHTTRELE
jgi:peptide chain release factor 3